MKFVKTFASRNEARNFSYSQPGLRVVDRGPNTLTGLRWGVVNKAQEKEDYKLVYAESRNKARAQAEETGGKVFDAGKGEDKRWWVKVPGKSYKARPAEKVAPAPIVVPKTTEEEPVVIMTMKNISVTVPGQEPLVMSRKHKDFEKCAALITSGDLEGLVEAMSVTLKRAEWRFGDDICVIDDVLYHFGMAVERTSLAKRIIADCNAGVDPIKYVNFFRKLMKNPSFNASKHVFDFIEHNDLQINDNGDIVAWKKVQASGYDAATGLVPNFVGMTVEMPRNQVEDDPNKTCSAGLHVAAKEYFNHHFQGGTMTVVHVSPEHIVSVPTDYNNSKCRTCKYTVVSGVKAPEGWKKTYILVDKDGNEIKKGE